MPNKTKKNFYGKNIQRLTAKLTVLVFVFSQISCVAGMPRPLLKPEIKDKPQTVKVVGLSEKGQYTTKQMIAFPKSAGTFELRGVEMPVKDAKLIDALSESNAASFFISEGTPNYQVLIEKADYKSDLVVAPLVAVGVFAVIIFFPVVVLGILPWPDKAKGEIHLKVYDDNGALLGSLSESGRVVYCNWGPLLLTSYGRKKAQNLYDVLNQRIATRAVELIQNDRAAKNPEKATTPK